jgi:short/branched chain acyl-CoA dehydrogenase
LKYARKREQFGQPISKFQAVAFKLADSAMEIECGRNLLYKACWLAGPPNVPSKKRPPWPSCTARNSWAGWPITPCRFTAATDLMKEYDVERFYRDQKLLDIGEGTSEVQRIVISRHIGC